MAVLDVDNIPGPEIVGASSGREPQRKVTFRRTPQSAWRGIFHFTVLVVYLAALVSNASAVMAQGPSEYEVKAAFLYNFAKFVEWPQPASGPIHLCIVGDDPFGNSLEETVRGKTINGRPVAIRRMKIGEDSQSCQIAFISATERPPRSVLDLLQGASTLTVGDSPNFAKQGGVINFVMEDNKVRFEINVDAAEQARLKISSKLLSLAKIVRNEKRTGAP